MSTPLIDLVADLNMVDDQLGCLAHLTNCAPSGRRIADRATNVPLGGIGALTVGGVGADQPCSPA